MVNAKKITLNTSSFLTAAIFQKVLSFIYFTILARYLGAESIGQYFFAISFASIFSVFMDLGLSPVLIREVAKSDKDEQQWFKQIFTFKLIFSFITIVIAIVLDNILFYSDTVRTLIYLTIFIILIDSFTLLFYSFIRGKQNLIYESWGIAIFQIIVLSIGFTLMQFTDNVILFLGVLFIASLFNLIYSGIILRFKMKIKLGIYYSKELGKKIFVIALPFALAAIFAKVYAYIDTVLLKVFLDDTRVGLYSVVYKITFALQFIPLAFVAALYPAFSHYFKNDLVSLRKTLIKAFYYLAFISLPISFGIIALSPEIIKEVYTDQFIVSIVPLQLLIVSIPLLFTNFAFSSFLNATDNQKINTRNLGIIMIINIILNIILIPIIEVRGAALASTISTLLLFILNLRYVWPIVNLKINVLKPILYSFISAIFMFISVYYGKTLVYWPLTIFIGIIVYFMLMFLSKTLSKKDFIFIKNAIFSKE